MKYLVTGGGGYTGMAVVKRLAERGDAVVAFDLIVSNALREYAESRPDVTPVAGNITSLPHIAQTFKERRPEAVVHLAGAVGAGQTMSNPWQVMEINVGGSLHMMEAMRLYDVKRMIFLSTEETWGDMNPVSKETDFQVPFLPYGISKLTVEHFCHTYNLLYGLQCISLRTSWIYSPGLPRPRPPNTIIEAALEGRSLHLPEGAETAVDFTYMDDLVDGVIGALDHLDHPFDVYNVASGQVTSFQQVVDIVKDLVPGADISVAPGPYHFPGGVPMPVKGILDGTRARETFGYQPKYDMRRGLEAFIKEWRKLNP